MNADKANQAGAKAEAEAAQKAAAVAAAAAAGGASASQVRGHCISGPASVAQLDAGLT